MHVIYNLTKLAFDWIGMHSTSALMGSKQVYSCAILCSFLLFSVTCRGVATEPGSGWTQSATLDVDASWWYRREIPKTLFGLFFEVRPCFFSFLSVQFNPPISALLATKDLML
jgi:hypothetical protein